MQGRLIWMDQKQSECGAERRRVSGQWVVSGQCIGSGGGNPASRHHARQPSECIAGELLSRELVNRAAVELTVLSWGMAGGTTDHVYKHSIHTNNRASPEDSIDTADSGQSQSVSRPFPIELARADGRLERVHCTDPQVNPPSPPSTS